jgi:hypothetical protein
MASKGVAGQEGGREGEETRVIKGPWAELPHRGEQAAFYDARDASNLITVQATAVGTTRIWAHYKEGARARRWPFVLMQFDGNPGNGIAHEYPEALETAILKREFVYNIKSRAAWRPVWYPSTPVEIRGLGNCVCEKVFLLGYKSFLPGWENRPRAKLFQND